MIEQIDPITLEYWKANVAPWIEQSQIAQDLCIHRALIELYNNLELDIEQIITCFNKYMEFENKKVSRAEFEENLYRKQATEPFIGDIKGLLSGGVECDFYKDFKLVMDTVIKNLEGEPWQGSLNE